MPRYEVKCDRCNTRDELTMSFKEFVRFKGERKVPPLQWCKECGTNALVLVPSRFTFSI